MLKRILFFVVLLLVGLYYGPIIYEVEREQEYITNIDNQEPFLFTENDTVYPLPANGYENYVGTNIDSYVERHGSPDKVIVDKESNRNWWSYHLHSDEFLQLEVVNKIIQSIFVMGNQVQTGTIHVGMTQENLHEETQLSDTFKFQVNSEAYQLNLTKAQKQRFPLVQFDNNTFAMIFFHPQLDNVYAIRYLSPSTLVRINYYETEGGEYLPLTYAPSTIEALFPLYSLVMFQNIENENFQYEPRLRQFGEQVIETEGGNRLTSHGLSSGSIAHYADAGKEVFYTTGNQIWDPPTRFGTFYNEIANHAIFRKTNKKTFAVKAVDDDLLFIFE